MSKFASKAPIKSSHKAYSSPEIVETRNFEGGVAFTLPVKERLATRVMTSLINESKFYGDNTQELISDINEVAKVDPEFLMKLAVYTRNVMYMRSSPIYVLALSSLINEVKPYIRKYTPYIVKRADEPAEVLSVINTLFHDKGDKPIIPNSIKKGLSDTLINFDEYQLAKYKGEGNSVNIYDVFNICHPRAKDEKQAEVWKNLMNGGLKPAKTWEVEISTKGSTAQNWEEIIPNMGYMALLRNLRNFLEKDVSEEKIKFVAKQLKNEKNVVNSKQLPFRFYSAYRELLDLNAIDVNRYYRKNKKILLDAISSAFDISCNKFDALSGSTAVFADHSGSMMHPLSDKSKVAYKEIATVLMAAVKISSSIENVAMIFGDTTKIVDNHGMDALRFVESVLQMHVGCSTYGYKCFEALGRTKVDRIIVLTDMQLYSESWIEESIAKYWDRYRKIYPNAYLHVVDLSGYGTTIVPINKKNVFLYAGWSDKFIELIPFVEKGVTSFIKEIENYKIF